MSTWLGVGSVLILVVLGALVWAADPAQVREQIEQKKVVPGQSARDVRTTLGEPTRILKTRTYWTTTEDWVYGDGTDVVLLTFEGGKLKRISDGSRPHRK